MTWNVLRSHLTTTEPFVTMFHGLRTFGSHGGSHGDRHGRLYPIEGPHTPHHGQKTLFGALTCSSWEWLTGRQARSLVEREIGDPGCADIRCHSQSLRSPASAMCAGEAHRATLLLAKVPCARNGTRVGYSGPEVRRVPGRNRGPSQGDAQGSDARDTGHRVSAEVRHPHVASVEGDFIGSAEPARGTT